MHKVGENEIRPLEIVGVAQDAKYRYISETGRNFIYVPLRQHPNSRHGHLRGEQLLQIQLRRFAPSRRSKI